MTFRINKKAVYGFFKNSGYAFSALLILILVSSGLPPELVFALFGSLGVGGYSHYQGNMLKQTEDEIKLVSLIREHEGQITLADIMIEFNCSGKAAISKVRKLEKQGIIGADVSAAGNLIYTLSPAYLNTF